MKRTHRVLIVGVLERYGSRFSREGAAYLPIERPHAVRCLRELGGRTVERGRGLRVLELGHMPGVRLVLRTGAP